MSEEKKKRTQKMVNLRDDLKDAFDEHLEKANVARRKKHLRRYDRSDLFAVMLKKLTKEDYLSTEV